MFKNAIVYLVDPTLQLDATLLTRQSARPCGATELRTDGFSAPCDHAEGLVHIVAGHQLICLQTEEKLLPGAVIAEAVKERAEEIEQQQGHKVGRKQLKEIKERVIQELLPQAFTTKKRTYAVKAGEYFIIDTGSSARAETLITALYKALEIAVSPLRTVKSPTSAMTEWLLGSDTPSEFTVDRDCELSSQSEEKAAVRYVNHNLDASEIHDHIAAGKSPTRLALTWNDRISLVITDQMALKRLQFLDILKEQAEQEAETMAELFDIDITIMAGELSRLIDALAEDLGGIKKPDPDLINSTNEVQP